MPLGRFGSTVNYIPFDAMVTSLPLSFFLYSKSFVSMITSAKIICDVTMETHHHHNEHNQGLGLKTCSFKAQGVFGLSIFVLVFPYPAVPEVGTGKPASVGVSTETQQCLLIQTNC
jgi:hypothetical protein